MTKWKTIAGYVWAGLGVPILLAGFIGQDFLVQKLFVEPGLKISARWSGGEIVQTIDHKTYQTGIHRPVFDGLFWERNKGFVQIDWTSEQELPEIIDENIDFDRDGKEDFQVTLNTQTYKATLIPFDSRAVSFTEDEVLIFERARTVRVVLKKKAK
jgi:hypothetical protein